MGEGFGWSVAACDLNDDGLDDLIAGSPMFRCLPIWAFSRHTGKLQLFFALRNNFYVLGTQTWQRYFKSVWHASMSHTLLHSDPSSEDKHNTGRVHFFLSTSEDTQWKSIDGANQMLNTRTLDLQSGARFGSAVSVNSRLSQCQPTVSTVFTVQPAF